MRRQLKVHSSQDLIGIGIGIVIDKGRNMTNKGRRLKEVKAEQNAKRRRAKRRKRAMFLMIEMFVLCVLLMIAYCLVTYGKIDIDILKDNFFQKQETSQAGYMTVALFGGDSREGKLEAGTHADTIMIASIDENSKEVRIVSVYRDMLSRQANGELKKANNGYYVGGPETAIQMLNENLDLSIQNYVTVNFSAVAEAVDQLGGIDVELSEAEATELNHYLEETKQVTGKEADSVTAGSQHLNGVQTVTYARIRHNVGGDYARTDRQRLVVEKLLQKAKDANVIELGILAKDLFPQVSTDFSLKNIIKLATRVSKYSIVGTSGYPFELTDGTIAGIGSVVIPLGHTENVQELHQFLYPKNEYLLSDTVKDIAAQMKSVAGY